MIDRPTPETDILYDRLLAENPGNLIYLEEMLRHARILERERDEAREALKHIEEYGTEEINAAVELRQKLARALVVLDNMQDQRDLAMKVIKRLEQERDDVREALASREVVIAQQNVITDLILECNTAREALMKIEQIFIDSDDTYEDLIKMGNIARSVLEAAK